MKKITVIIFCLMALYTQAQNTFPATGNVGIGTVTPKSSLEISTSKDYDGIIIEHKKNGFWTRYLAGSLLDGAWNDISRTNDAAIIFGGKSIDNSQGFVIAPWSAAASGIRIDNKGNVGIGTANPTQKLSVNGTIQAKEIIVNTGWFDFVFDNNYKLRPLTEVEQFVKTNKHLPEIPSQKEVEKNGVQLGDISSKLLMKIEELTLYIIQQQKEIEKQKAINIKLENEIKKLQNK